VSYSGRKRVYSVHLVLLAFVVATLVGVERLAHLDWCRDDAVLIKWLRLPKWPVRKVFSAALQSLGESSRVRLEALVGDFGLQGLEGVTSVVVDVDSTAIVDYGRAEGAKYGYCGKGRNRRRHYPLVASVAETRAVIGVRYRGGDAIDADELVAFFTFIADRVHAQLGKECKIVFRADSGMWSNALSSWMRKHGHTFILSFPMRPDVKGALLTSVWADDDDDDQLGFTVVDGAKLGLAGLRVVGIRRRDDDPENPAQGKLVKGCHAFRYQALITDLPWEAKDAWRFYNHRADCERVFRVGKQALALGHLVGHDYDANAAAFLLRMLAFNLDLMFQRRADAVAQAAGRKVRKVGIEWRQFRFYCSPGRLLLEHSRWVLRVPTNDLLWRTWQYYSPLIERTSSVGVAM